MRLASIVFTLALTTSLVGDHFAPRAAAQTPSIDVPGEWLMGGQTDQPCAIFRQGAVLLVVNERGDLATGRMDGGGKLVILKGDRWQSGLTASVQDGGRSLLWRDGTTWTRR
jgi:hypothetical protein